MADEILTDAVGNAYRHFPVTPGYAGDKFVQDIYRAARDGYIAGFAAACVSQLAVARGQAAKFKAALDYCEAAEDDPMVSTVADGPHVPTHLIRAALTTRLTPEGALAS